MWNMIAHARTCIVNILKTMLLMSVVAFLPVLVQAVEIGKVQFIHGAVTAQAPSQALRILGKDTPVSVDDVITVADSSYAVLELHDGTRMSLRPNTVLQIREYSEEPDREKATIYLYRGGLRIVSGFISKLNPDAFKVTTAVSTIGISGTELDARLCETDCATEAAEVTAPEQELPASSVAGRVAFLRGELTATNAAGTVRQMAKGGPLINNEDYTTGADAYALLVFRDGGRISLKAESTFRVEGYEFDETDPTKANSSLRLVKGGLRALTGKISDSNPDAYQVNTSVTTIGIRGTGFDLVWLGPCTGSSECGLVASVWQGAIFSRNNSGTTDIGLNQTARISAINLPLEFIDTPPAFTIPRPDAEDIDLDAFFAAQAEQGITPGLFVACYEGHCSLHQQDQTVDLGAGESGFAGSAGEPMVRLSRIESFQFNDEYLRKVTDSFDTLFELQDSRASAQSQFECVME